MSRRTVPLPADARAATVARRAIEPAVRALDPERRADVLLLTSELVTNAFRHGSPPITLTIDSQAGCLRVEVEDVGDGRPARRPDPGPAGGWGLLLVEEAADRWGVVDGSTNVWFEVDLGG
jgi:anti-sigma regulatory factor (Ser/Thr protein kinase)